MRTTDNWRLRATAEACCRGHEDWYLRPDGRRECRVCNRTRARLHVQKRLLQRMLKAHKAHCQEAACAHCQQLAARLAAASAALHAWQAQGRRAKGVLAA